MQIPLFTAICNNLFQDRPWVDTNFAGEAALITFTYTYLTSCYEFYRMAIIEYIFMATTEPSV